MRSLVIGILVLLGVVVGGWMVFDAVKRLTTGDFTRIDGELGPWTYLVNLVRLDPMGVPVALLFLFCGLARLVATAGLACGAPWGWKATLITSVAVLWFLPIGTLCSVITIVLLCTPPLRLLRESSPPKALGD
jgi:hypothetical protein